MSPITSATSPSTLPGFAGDPARSATRKGPAASPQTRGCEKPPSEWENRPRQPSSRFQMPWFHSTWCPCAACAVVTTAGCSAHDRTQAAEPSQVCIWAPPPQRDTVEEVTDRLILITLLVKLGVMASVASVLARGSTFRRLFFAEHRRPRANPGPAGVLPRSPHPRRLDPHRGPQLPRRRHLL